MGQYYYPIILRQKGNRTFSNCFYAHDINHNGLKLTEHSWVGNSFTETVLAQLYNNPGRLIWFGDYTKKDDFEDDAFFKTLLRHYKKYRTEVDWSKPFDDPNRYLFNNYTHPEIVKQRLGRFILNHSKKLFIDMDYYENIAPKNEWTDAPLHPLPLLTCSGNGRGGGDYYGPNKEDCGCWAGDLIEVQDEVPEDYKEVTEDCACYIDA